jgi:hypothetical protein
MTFPAGHHLNQSRGQMTIEMLLMIIVMLAMGLTLSRFAKSQGWAKSLVSGPWKPLQAMIENGVWTPADAKQYHPHHRRRHGSYESDPVPGGGSDDGGLD